MSSYPDLEAMREIALILEGLDPENQMRVLAWVNDRFSLSSRKPSIKLSRSEDMSGVQKNIQPDTATKDVPISAENLAELFATISPASDSERALIVGYWFQQIEGKENFRSFDVNETLKQLGHRINNITRAFDHLQGRTPQLAIQVRKKGKSQQARKRYQITIAGIRFIENRLS